MRSGFFVCVSVLEVASRRGVGLAGCGCVLNPPVVCSAGRSGAVARCWSCSLFLCGLFCGAVCFVLCCLFLCFLVHFSIAITSLGEERAGFGAFRAFVRFASLVLPVSSSSCVWEELRFVIVALPGLSSYLLL